MSSDDITITSKTVDAYRRLYALGREVELTPEMVRLHWELERRWAVRLLASRAASRAELFAEAYSELYARLPWLMKSAGKEDAAGLALRYGWWMRLLPSRDPLSILEIGAGSGGLIRFLASAGHICTASDVTSQRVALDLQNRTAVSWIQADAVEIGALLPLSSFAVVISDQVLEHLHPDEVEPHFASIRKLLVPGGLYLVRVPHRAAGPLDLSQLFHAREARGMHLKEYSYRELAWLATRARLVVVAAFFAWPLGLRRLSRSFERPLRGKWLLWYFRAVEWVCDLPWLRPWSRRLFIAATLSKNVCLMLERPSYE